MSSIHLGRGLPVRHPNRAIDISVPARLADDPMQFNPATAETLVNLMLGGLNVFWDC